MTGSNPNTSNPFNQLFSKQTLLLGFGFLVVYVSWLLLFIGFREDHFYFILCLTIAYFSSSLSRKFVLSFIFFWIFWFIYDAMRLFPNYQFADVHIIEPYILEKSIFGISDNGTIITPNEWAFKYPNKISDFISGIFYLTWVPLPMLFCLFLFFKNRRMLLRFSGAFFFTNIIGFSLYYIYPAAPPWYVHYYGQEIDFSIIGNAAQLTRFDDLINMPLFEKMYNKNANVFAAIPSLHAAYPVVLLFYGWMTIKDNKKYKWMLILFILDVIGIWYSAVYSMHHYIIDVLLGGICAIIAIFVFEIVILKSYFSRFIDKYEQFIL